MIFHLIYVIRYYYLIINKKWYPRLLHSTEEERNKWRLIGKGDGIHWDDLDEDISIMGLLAGKPSQESHSSFKKWLDNRNKKADS